MVGMLVVIKIEIDDNEWSIVVVMLVERHTEMPTYLET